MLEFNVPVLLYSELKKKFSALSTEAQTATFVPLALNPQVTQKET